MKTKLVVVGGDAKAAEINLRLPTVIGRGREADLHLPHPLVSRQHCQIFEQGSQLYVRDLGSLNGTYVGNERVEEAALPSGELLTVGTVTFRAVYDSDSDLSPPTSELSKKAEKTSIGRQSSDTVCDPNAGTVEAPSAKSAASPEDHESDDTPELPPTAGPGPTADDDGELNSFLRGTR